MAIVVKPFVPTELDAQNPSSSNPWPFHATRCVMCGSNGSTYIYSVQRVISSGGGLMVSTSTHNDTPTPHLRRTCGQCGYVWFTKTMLSELQP